MAVYTIYALGASNIEVSDSGSLSGITQGDASHLEGRTITLLDNDWEPIVISDDETNFADNDGNQRLEGAQSFDGTAYADNLRIEAEYTVQVTDGVNTYTLIGFNINEPGFSPAYGTVEGLAFLDEFPPIGVPLTVLPGGASEGPGNSGATAVGPPDFATPPCFTPGTRVRTPMGSRAIETLGPGDMVSTLDVGPCAIVLVAATEITRDRLRQDPEVRPVIVRAGALGPGRPCRDMRVSPQHRFLMRGGSVELLAGTSEALVAAKHLICGTGVRRDDGLEPVTYLHLILKAHHVIFADGVATESFLPGPETRRGLDTATRAALARISDRADWPPARLPLRRGEGRLLRTGSEIERTEYLR
ncbi:MAG: Hint domain-containing protein [Pseudomonadota bacterium]